MSVVQLLEKENKNLKEKKKLILVDADAVKLTAQDYFENLFEPSEFNLKKKHFIIRNITFNKKVRMFQCKV